MIKPLGVIILTGLIFVAGCAAIGVPLTSNPETKIRYAYSLMHEQDRPLPAEPLIWESIDIYKKKGDNYGLAQAFRAYGYFLISNAVSHLGSHDFKDKTVTLENKQEKAIEYWKKAIELFMTVNSYDGVSNMYCEIGRIYHLFYNDKDKACDFFLKSLEAHRKFAKDNPGQGIVLPEGFHSYEEYIQKAKEEAGCDAQ